MLISNVPFYIAKHTDDVGPVRGIPLGHVVFTSNMSITNIERRGREGGADGSGAKVPRECSEVIREDDWPVVFPKLLLKTLDGDI